MSIAKVNSMVALPIRSSLLCFEVGGILDRLDTDLGGVVKDIPYEKLTDPIRISPFSPADPSRHRFDAPGIINLTRPFALATLRNEMTKSALNTAVNTRQNVYYSKYENSASVISTIRASYSRTSPASKPNFINILEGIAEEQFGALSDAYMEDDRIGVVKATSSTTTSESGSFEESLRFSNFTQESRAMAASRDPKTPMPIILPDITYDGNFGQPVISNRPQARRPANSVITNGYNFERTKSTGSAHGTQTASNVDYEYRTPYLDTRARHMRALISLIDQGFESFMFEQNIPHLEKIFENELASIDNDVYQFQIALLRTFLISPIPGIVTGVYKNPGDAVSPGEPVLRIENNDSLRLVANLIHRGPIATGATAAITSSLFGPSDPPTTLSGNVLFARGQGDRNQWEVVIQIKNIDPSGNHILPLGYNFDQEFTSLTIS